MTSQMKSGVLAVRQMGRGGFNLEVISLILAIASLVFSVL